MIGGRRSRRARPGRVRTGLSWRTVVAVFLAVFVVSGAGGTAGAFWSVPAVPLSGTANAATASVTLAGTAGLQKEYRFTPATPATASNANLVIAPVVFTNTGTSPLTLSAAWSGNAGAYPALITVTYWAGASGACASTLPSSGTTAGTLAAPPALPAGVTSVAIGAAVTLCVATSLNSTVALQQGKTVSPVLTLTGRVGTNWTTSVSAPAFTQSVFRVAAPTGISCVTTPGTLTIAGYATLTWNAVTYGAANGVDTARAASYDLHIDSAANPSIQQVTPAAGAATVSVQVNALNLGVLGFVTSGTKNVVVTTTDSVYGTTSVASATLVMRYGLLPLLSVQCPA